MSPLYSPATAKSRLGRFTQLAPEKIPDARRDLFLANLAKLARETVDQAIATGASLPTDEQRAALRAILAPWLGDAA